MNLLLFVGCFIVVYANKPAYENWESYLKEHYRADVKAPAWKNYENWNQWIKEEAPKDLAPSKERLDSWRKWNLGKESLYGPNWQTLKQDVTKDQSVEKEDLEKPQRGTKEWMSEFAKQYGEFHGKDQTTTTSLAATSQVEKDDTSGEKRKKSYGPYNHPKEVPLYKDPTDANQMDWKKWIPDEYGSMMSSKQPTADEESARQSGDVNWRKYIPESYHDNIPKGFSHDGEGSKKKAKADDITHEYSEKYAGKEGDYERYIPKSRSDYTDWKKYVGDQAGFEKRYGGEGNDWGRYIPAGTDGSGSGSGSGSGRGGRHEKSGDDDEPDFSKYTEWKKYADQYAPSSQSLFAKPSHTSKKEDDSTQSSPNVDWRSFVPEDYRHYVPEESTIEGANKNNTQGKPVDWKGFVPAEYRHFIPNDTAIAAQEKAEKAQQASKKDSESSKSHHHHHHQKEHDREHQRETSNRKHRRSEDPAVPQTQTLASLPTTTSYSWSALVTVLVMMTFLVALVSGTYIIKKLKQRHCDYEQVDELDVDRLLLV